MTLNGKVTYFYLPVPDLKAARTFYRDLLGLEEAWREGESTCAFRIPGSEIQVMLNEVTEDSAEEAGLVFKVPSTSKFYEQQGQFKFLDEPSDIPGGGQWVAVKNGSGQSVYIGDVE